LRGSWRVRGALTASRLGDATCGEGLRPDAGHGVKRRFGMSQWMFVVAALLGVLGLVGAPLATAGEAVGH
jgi:hypothetical protein